MLVINDPDHIKKIMRATNEADPNPFIQEMILGQLLGTPKENIKFFKNDNGVTDHKQITHMRKHVTGSPLIALSKKVYERLKCNIDNVFAQRGNDWMDIPDLFLFVQHHVTLATTETLMGTSIVSHQPDLIDDLWKFMDRTNEMVMQLPYFVIPKAYDARSRLLANLKRWDRESGDTSAKGSADPIWDPIAGSGLLQERQEMYKQIPTFDEDARSSQTLGLILGGTGFTAPVTFWFLYHALQNAALSKRVASEIRQHFNADTEDYVIPQLVARPILQSLHAETTRYYSSNVAVRVITAPTFTLDDKYVLKKNTTIYFYTKFTGTYTQGWASVRPSTIQKPLHEFWPERFLLVDEAKTEKFSDAKLEGNWTAFGGGEHKCPGRHFARNIGIVALAVLMGEYECELSDARDVRPNMTETGFGKMEPLSKVRARMRRRVK